MGSHHSSVRSLHPAPGPRLTRAIFQGSSSCSPELLISNRQMGCQQSTGPPEGGCKLYLWDNLYEYIKSLFSIVSLLFLPRMQIDFPGLSSVLHRVSEECASDNVTLAAIYRTLPLGRI